MFDFENKDSSLEFHLCPSCSVNYVWGTGLCDNCKSKIHLCPNCHVNYIWEIGVCDECQRLEKKQKIKKTLSAGLIYFNFFVVIIAIILLLVLAVIAFFRLDGFGLPLFEVIGLWIISVAAFIIAVIAYISFDEETEAARIRKNSKSNFLHKFNGILHNLLALYDAEEIDIGLDDILAFSQKLGILAILFVSVTGIVADIAILIVRDWLDAFTSGAFVSFWSIALLPSLIYAACYNLGEEFGDPFYHIK